MLFSISQTEVNAAAHRAHSHWPCAVLLEAFTASNSFEILPDTALPPVCSLSPSVGVRCVPDRCGKGSGDGLSLEYALIPWVEATMRPASLTKAMCNRPSGRLKGEEERGVEKEATKGSAMHFEVSLR